MSHPATREDVKAAFAHVVAECERLKEQLRESESAREKLEAGWATLKKMAKAAEGCEAFYKALMEMVDISRHGKSLLAEMEALKTDNQLLREQIRVGDVAFNGQRSELQCASDILGDCKEVLNEVVAHGNCDCDIPNGHTCIPCECALLCKRIDSTTTIPNELDTLRKRVKEAEWIIGPINLEQLTRPTIHEWIQRRDKFLEGVKHE